jgi:uncharacterized protein (TIGR03437 family)
VKQSFSLCLRLSLALGLWIGWTADCSAQATLVATPATLSFTWQIGSTLPAAQTVAIKAGTSTAAYTTAVPGAAPWLSVSPDAGKLPASLSVRVNPNGLSVGVYQASVQLTATGIASPVLIPVMLTVEPPLPTLAVSSALLNFVVPANPPPVQTLQLATSGAPIPFTAAVQGATWLTVAPTSGVVLPGAPITLTVSVDATGIDPLPLAYSGKIVVTASGVPSTNKATNVTVGLLVNALTPTITSLWPAAALAGSGATTITIRGTGFYKATTAKASGASTPLKTTFLSPTVLLADVPANLTAVAGPLNVVVTNPAPGGDSVASVFTVSATPVVQATVNAASYAPGAVSLGELVTIFGSSIGPSTPSGMSVIGGFATQILQNVSVAIDGKNAAMVYVSQNQITVQVPYTAGIGLAKAVVINNGGVFATGVVDVAAVSPGIFALDGSGLGQAAALTFSMQTGLFALNGTTSPAHAGDIVILYLTGEGDYATAIVPRTGYIVPANLNPLPQLSPLPTVTIGGAAAIVQYAGPAPGGILGVLQVNAVVPAASTIGVAVPVIVTIGNVSTQAGVTLVIK